jgi:hypothetical protein
MRRTARAVAFVALFGALAGCRKEPVRLPEELCGRWATDDPKYAGRYLELSNEAIRFGNGDEELAVCAVVSIERSGQGADVHYDVTYLDSNSEESIFSFSHHATRASIRIAHSPGRIWKRVLAGEESPDSPVPDEKVETKAENPER